MVLSGLAVALLHAQTLWLHHRLLKHRSLWEEPGPHWALLLSLWAGLALLPRTLQWIAGVVLTSLFALIGFVDANYFRFFRELPSWHLLPTWRQAGRTTDSVGTVVQPDDALLFLAPLLLLGLGGWWVVRRWRRPAARPVVALILCLSAGLGVWQVARGLPEVRWIQLQRRFQNIALAGIFGPLYYHAYDSYESARIALGWESGVSLDEGLVNRVLAERRAQATQATPFQGMFEGRDLIWLQLESLENFAVDAEFEGRPVMPFLQHLGEVGFRFRLFDQTHLGRSADGQFIYLNSLHPPAQRPLPFAYPNNRFVALPQLFQEQGYETMVLHPSDPSFWNCRLMAQAYGFQTRLFRDDLPPRNVKKEVRGWGLTDRALFGRLLERVRSADARPYFAYVVTVMCHHPYPEVKDQEEAFPPPQPLSMLRRYLRCCHWRDQALRSLVEELGKTERGRRTVLCLTGDHDSNVSERDKFQAGLPLFPGGEEVPWILVTVESALKGQALAASARPPQDFGAQMDVAPSLAHVFSLPMEQTVFLGWNLFHQQESGPRISRLGTWMDRRGIIKPPEDTSEALDRIEFSVSEMLLQSDRIPDFRASP